METENAIAISLSIIALVACLVIGTVMYFNQPESVDISGINENSILITSLQNDVGDLQDEVDDIPLSEVSEDDLEDLEESIEDLEEDIDDIEDAIEDIEYGDVEECFVDSVNWTEFKACLY